MITNRNSSYNQLIERISVLREEKLRCEQKIKEQSQELYQVMTSPGEIIKRTVKDLSNDGELRADLLKSAVGGVSQYLVFRFAKNAVSELASKLFSKLAEKAKDTKLEGVVNMINNVVSGKKNNTP